MAVLAIHYTGFLPMVALLLASTAGLRALREGRPRAYQYSATLLLLVVAAASALSLRSGAPPAYPMLALGFAVAAVALSSTLTTDSEKLYRYAALLVVAGWLLYWVPFVTLDFSLHEVFWNTSPGLPLWMRFAAAWSGGGGSLFLFSLLAALGGLFLLRGSGGRAGWGLVAGLSAVLVVGLVAAFLNDAFTLLETRPASGAGLNPLLKSPWLYPHPLTTFGGYALLAVAAVGFLAGAGRRRSWTVYEIGWAMLTVGIMLGGYWSYETFGWGGYWAWDPVETSELMVWLASTLLPHLVIASSSSLSFTAALMGSSVFLAMYVTRTGLSPLHSFAAPGVGALVLLGSGLLLLAYAVLRLGASGDKVLGELGRSLLSGKPYQAGMAVAALALLGSALFVYATLFVPSLMVALGKQVSVPQMDAGIRFFHPVLYPLLLVMLAAIPLAFNGEWLGWRGYAALATTTGVASVVLVEAVRRGYYELAPLSPASTEAMMAAGLPWAALAAASTLVYLALRLRRSGLRVLLRDRLAPMSLLHLGLALTVIGVLLSGTYSFNDFYTWEAHLKPGDTITIPGGASLQLVSYSFGISNSTVDIYTNYVGRSTIYFYAWQGLQALAGDLGHLITLYEQGRQVFESNETVQLLAQLSKHSPFELNTSIGKDTFLNITMLVFNVEAQNISRVPLYHGEARIMLEKPVVQIAFNLNPEAEIPTGTVEAYITADMLRLEAASNITPVKKALGVHEAAVIRLNEPLEVNVSDGNTSFTLVVEEAALYSSALIHGGRGEPVNISSHSISGSNVMLYITRGRIVAENKTVTIPLRLPPEVATYLLVEESPGTKLFLEELNKTAPDLYQLLRSPDRIMELTRDQACLASPSGCVAHVRAPKLVPETAWLDIVLRINNRSDVRVRIRFEAYGEIQGIHGLVSKVIHPSLGLDDVYVVVSPPTKTGELSGSPYHELLLYYLHETMKRLNPEERLALVALMASGYNIDTLQRLSGERAMLHLEQSIIDLYMAAKKYDPSNSTIKTQGLYVQVKVIPGVRLVWLGPVVMALGAVYAATVSWLAARKSGSSS